LAGNEIKILFHGTALSSRRRKPLMTPPAATSAEF
jgi:hypothetical protein